MTLRERFGGLVTSDDDAVDTSPTVVGRAIAVVAVAVGLGLLREPFPLVLWTVGGGLVVVGGGLARRRIVNYGTAGLLGAVLLTGHGIPIVIACTLLALLAWDVTRYSIALGAQLGREVGTTRVELTHAAVTAGVGSLSAGIGVAAYRLAPRPDRVVVVLALLLLGVMLLLTALTRT